jgi:hypothetical protein
MADSKGQIAFEELGLGSVLKRYLLRVPPNQREYSWTDREVRQLLQDFAKAINEDGFYFLGTVVTIPQGEGVLEVVDGQQRLATTAILLAGIRDYLSEKDENVIVESIDNEFLSGVDREKRIRVPKLTLNVDDNELFNWIVAGEPGTEPPGTPRASHGKLMGARDEVRKHVARIVSPLDEKEHGDALNRWVSFVEHRAVVVLLRVPNTADAYKMFETLNDRGLRTSQADLVKNYLFSKAGSRLAEVQSKWSFMRGALESASEDAEITITFLRHALIVQQGHLTAADVYDSVQKVANSEPTAASLAGTLETLANVYVATFNPDHERWNSYPDEARRALEVLNLLDVKPLRSLLLAVGSNMSEKEAPAALNFLISLSVRLMIAGNTRSGSVEEPLANAAHAVRDGKIDTADALRKALSDITPSDDDFEREFAGARVSNAKLARYYLRSMETTAAGESEPWYVPREDKQVINLEHVLPKKPESSWPQFSDDEVRRFATRLGNQALMLAADNSNLKSTDFEEKKKVYAGSPYVLTSEIAEFEEWNGDAIDRRQVRLAAVAVNTWPLK